MIVYSKKIIRFVNEIKSIVKDILSKEIRVKVYGDRFYDGREKSSFPISIVIFNNKSMLGYFKTDFYELGFHERLMYSSKEQLKNVIRHELAHYFNFINCGYVQDHGSEFRTFCQRMNWGENVYKATTCFDDQLNTPNIEESSVLRKVQKLMSLSTSSNRNEAELAMIKSQQLLLKHNIEAKYASANDDEEKIILKRIMKQKKENAKMRCVAEILKTFFVNVIYNKQVGFIYLEILGSAVNIEIAEYVADFLARELDHMWEEAKQQNPHIKGIVAKNSFFYGVAKGYCKKIDALKKDYNSDVNHSLMVIEKMLVDASEMVYSRLHSKKSRGSLCSASSSIGEKMGRQLNIKSAIHTSSKNSGALLPLHK